MENILLPLLIPGLFGITFGRMDFFMARGTIEIVRIRVSSAFPAYSAGGGFFLFNFFRIHLRFRNFVISEPTDIVVRPLHIRIPVFSVTATRGRGRIRRRFQLLSTCPAFSCFNLSYRHLEPFGFFMICFISKKGSASYSEHTLQSPNENRKKPSPTSTCQG